jgi:hypothetical protein
MEVASHPNAGRGTVGSFRSNLRVRLVSRQFQFCRPTTFRCLRLRRLLSPLTAEVGRWHSGMPCSEALCRVVTEQRHNGARKLLDDGCNVDDGLVVHDPYFRSCLPQSLVEEDLEPDRALGIRTAHH